MLVIFVYLIFFCIPSYSALVLLSQLVLSISFLVPVLLERYLAHPSLYFLLSFHNYSH